MKRLILFSLPTEPIKQAILPLLFPDEIQQKVFAYMPCEGVLRGEKYAAFTKEWESLSQQHHAEFVLIDNASPNAAEEHTKLRRANILFITLPGIRPTLMFLMLMTTIWSFFTFEYVYILTGGGPAGSTDVLSTLLFRNALSNNLAGYATAQALVMALGGAVVAFGLAILRKRGWEV